MKIISLQSGSNGNCIYVEAEGVRLLFDAGISGTQAQQRLAAHEVDIGSVDALLISHDHRDHAQCLGIYQRKFCLPVHVTRKTLDAATIGNSLGKLDDVQYFQAGDALRLGGIVVETIPTPHDGADGVGFVVDDGRQRVGILTDLGHVFDGLESTVCSLDAVLLESNYDPAMLANGSYPDFVKARIRGSGGHLSNIECAELLAAAFDHRLRWACLGHLSEHNNTPALALRTHREVLGECVALQVASRYQAGQILEV
jgi:phosphoribosyl 1,2-cyclic phosphodiesterase